MKRKYIYIFVILTFFIPAYTKVAMNPQDTSMLITEVLSNPIIYQFNYLFFIGKIFLIMFFVGSIFLKNKYTMIYSIKASILLLFVAVFQSISTDTSYGFAVLIGNIISQTIIVILFLWEAKVKRNDFSSIKISPINIITLLLAFFAFWMPARNGEIYFSIKNLFFNEAGLTFCMIIPVIIASLLLYYKSINLTLLKIMSFIGIYYGLLNMFTWFVLNPAHWWMGITHLPLLVNSTIGFVLAIKEQRDRYKNAHCT